MELKYPNPNCEHDYHRNVEDYLACMDPAVIKPEDFPETRKMWEENK